MKKLISLFLFVFVSTAALAGHHKMSEHKDIVDTAARNEMFSTLVAAVKAGDLVSTLKGDGPFTVFAPTNDAFAALPDGTLEMLLKPENKATLVKILTYHVVAGKVTSKEVTGLKSASTVEGSDVAISVMGGNVKINNATVIKADVMTSNGVIHVIDTVLLPSEVQKAL
ncbi:fasciclin [Alteromonas sp. V450]|uniref:fasciclin domain-containing protein n=1 Tax=Alteromonas sp. V450 TaxID=1912139 RepID=UPI0008FF1620|nr:fasciclin domain-containing protein [Alteromonas sp. V450]OJF69383.1 fasciclin [Alteromonas sp. V450]